MYVSECVINAVISLFFSQEMARGRKAKVANLLAHQKGIKQLPDWTNHHDMLHKVGKMTAKQHALYTACIDHVMGDANIHDHYIGIKEDIFDDLKKQDKKALADLQKNSGSQLALQRWHRKAVSHKLRAGGWASGIGSAFVSGVKSTGKAALSGVKKVGSFLLDKGMNLARSAWSTVKSAAAGLQKIGGKVMTWFNEDPKRLVQLMEVVKSGVSIVKALQQSGAGKELEKEAGVSEERQTQITSVLDDDTDTDEGTEDEDEETEE